MRGVLIPLLAGISAVALADPPAETPAAEKAAAPALQLNEHGVVPFLADAQRGIGHCHETEAVVFSCLVKGSKALSLCGSTDGSSLQYRFGPIGTPELIFPPDGDRAQFSWAELTWMQGMEHSVSFEREGHRYQLVTAIGTMDESNNYEGVKVFKGDKELAFVRCTEGAEGLGLEKAGELVPKAPE